jgi:PAS domain S-box-containing protein
MSVLIGILAAALGVALAVHLRRRHSESAGRYRTLLEQSEERYSDLFANSPIGLYRTTPDGQILLANPALLRMVGCVSFEELASRNIETGDFEPHYSRQEFKSSLERAGEILGREELWTTRDGRTIAVRESARAVRDHSGAVLYYEGTVEDVTGRKLAEDALAEANSKLEAVMRQSPLAIVTTDPDGNVASWNPSAEGMFGWNQEEVRGRALPCARNERDLRRRIDACRRGEALPASEQIAVRKDGTDLDVSIWTGAMRDASGALAGIVCMVADNTERKRQELLLLDSERRYRDLIEHANDVIYSIDLEGHFTSMNPAGAHLTGYTQAELLEMNLAELLEPEQIGRVRQRIQEKLAGAPPGTFELSCRTRDGRPLAIEIISRLLFADGVPVGLQAIGRDSTERKKWAERLEQYAEELKNKNTDLSDALDRACEAAEAKNRFFANMSHEIRTPLNGVVGMTELLLDTSLTTEQREYCDTLKGSAEGLLAVVDNLLDISKIKTGRLEIRRAPFDFGRVIGAVADLLRPEALRKHLALTCSTDERLPRMVVGDEARLRQVITNLAANAVKFTERGEVKLQLRVDNEADRTVTVVCTVEDTGIGISREDASRIFQNFAQADTSTTRKYNGAGLGLAISTQLVEMMGGRLEFESEPGRGSRFWFGVTLEKHADACPQTDTGAGLRILDDGIRRKNAGTARILLAEDNEVNQRLTLRMLERSGYQADVVPNGLRAVAEVLTGRYDLVLMDIHMPEMDGFNATREIRRREGGDRHTPVIAITARAMAGDRERCLAAGMDDYVSKPVRRKELTGAIERWLRRPGRSADPLPEPAQHPLQ